MGRDPRYDILFEPVRIGPKIARNRFYQVPHCNGMGHRYPQMMAGMRTVKAEGGWGVVCTEECPIHPTSDLSPFTLMRLWDDSDLPSHELMVDGVHEHGALAGIQLVHGGYHMANHYTRLTPLAPSAIPAGTIDPWQAVALTREDIRDLRRWHREAALRSKKVGYDIVYLYAAHDMTILMHFMLKRYNNRTDEYGGSLENRLRLFREIYEETREVLAGDCAIAFRLAVDELQADSDLRADAEGRDIVEMLAELPDLWDVNVSGWENDSLPSRFGPEGNQEPFIGFVKKVTSKPVVGVGRFTSPDTMVSQIRRGVLDLIGAARPSIADPFLPAKVESGREDEIRECIGCNMCISGDYLATPMRCTQNPTMGEEWRRGWHPERIAPAGSNDSVLIIGGGPAGLEAALSLSRRGYPVVLAEAEAELGGRVLKESRLPGLGEWKRVVDHRTYMIGKLPNVTVYTASRLSAEDVLEYGFQHIVVATGARWRTDGMGRNIRVPLPVSAGATILSPNDILDGAEVGGRVLIFDDDHYYLATSLAQKLRLAGCEVTYATPAAEAAAWTQRTLEQGRIQRELLESGVEIRAHRRLTSIDAGKAVLECTYTGRAETVDVNAVIPVTMRDGCDSLYVEIMRHEAAFATIGLKSVTRIGDCHAPGTIAMAVYAGHRYARQLDNPVDQTSSFLRDNHQPVSRRANP